MITQPVILLEVTKLEVNKTQLLEIFDVLLQDYGLQNWWPADSPFEVMIGAILTQNTNWINVERALDNLKSHVALDVEGILSLTPSELADAIRPSGYFNLKAARLRNFCEWLKIQGGVEKLNRVATAALRSKLLSINGIGPETADAILLYAFGRSVFVIDAYTRRLFGRLGLIDGDEPYEQLRYLLETTLDGGAEFYNEYHALIVRQAKSRCKKTPRCNICALGVRCPRGGVVQAVSA